VTVQKVGTSYKELESQVLVRIVVSRDVGRRHAHAQTTENPRTKLIIVGVSNPHIQKEDPNAVCSAHAKPG
jgi:hypothetical protein